MTGTGTARVYGRTEDWSSQAVVTKGLASGLESHGVLAGLVGVDVDLGLDDDPPPGATADAGIYAGPPHLVDRLRFSPHRAKYAFLVPNSNVVPLPLLRAAETCAQTLLAPSEWAAEQLRAALSAAGIALRVRVVRHGVVRDLQLTARVAELRAREAEVSLCTSYRHWLHFSTSAFGRKGTRELLEAWGILAERGKLGGRNLRLVLDPDARSSVQGLLQRLRRGRLISEHLILEHRGFGAELRGLSPGAMRLALAQAGGVIQPSRGEGFGLVPLEARAAGAVVVATATTGHSEHLHHRVGPEDGVIIVPSGPLAQLDDGPAAQAPSVPVDGLVAALEEAFEREHELRAAARARAEAVQAAWSWHAVTAELAHWVRQELVL